MATDINQLTQEAIESTAEAEAKKAEAQAALAAANDDIDAVIAAWEQIKADLNSPGVSSLRRR